MKPRDTIRYKIQNPVMSDRELRFLIEGIIVQRENLVKTGSPYPPMQEDREADEQRKRELYNKIEQCQNKIKELEAQSKECTSKLRN